MSPTEIKQTVKEQEELIEMFDHFVDHHMGNLKGAEIKIWLALLTNVFEGTVHTTAHELAEVIGLSNNSARQALRSLIRMGLIEVVQPPVGRKVKGIYKLHSRTVRTGE